MTPAYARLDALLADQLPQSTDDAGVWRLPDGDAYYRWALRHHTSTDLGPAEIHELGLQEVARIHGEMRTVLAEMGIEAGDPVAAMVELAREPRFRYSEDDTGRDEILADFRSIVSGGAGALARALRAAPPRRGRRWRGCRLSGRTGPPAPTTSLRRSTGPGPAPSSPTSPTWTTPCGGRCATLAYHEAIPGHHHQIALAMEQTGMPLFRRVIPFTAFVEGWALYAELIADEAGWHPTPARPARKARGRDLPRRAAGVPGGAAEQSAPEIMTSATPGETRTMPPVPGHYQSDMSQPAKEVTAESRSEDEAMTEQQEQTVETGVTHEADAPEAPATAAASDAGNCRRAGEGCSAGARTWDAGNGRHRHGTAVCRNGCRGGD